VLTGIVNAVLVFTQNVNITKGRNRSLMKLTEFIREKDVLDQWPMSKATLIRARKKGLPFVRLGAFVCYRPEELEKFFCQPRSTPKGKGERISG
jgi:hypothetical protein